MKESTRNDATVANITDAVCDEQPAMTDELVRYVDVPESELILGEPALLMRKQK
jgi:hypothetical protein